MRAYCTLHVIHCKLHVEHCILHIVLHCFVAPIMFLQLILLHICWISASSLSSLLSAYVPTDQRPWSSRTNRLRIKSQGSRIKDQMWESASFIHSGKDGTIHLTLLAKCRFQRGRVWSKVGSEQKQFPSQGEKGSDIYINYFTYFE